MVFLHALGGAMQLHLYAPPRTERGERSLET